MPASQYLPVLALRPAEMLALQELPAKDKDALVPLFRLGCWGASQTLNRSVERLKKAFGNRPCFLEVGDEEYIDPDKRRPVHGELERLRDPANGYQHWHDFLAEQEHSHFIPTLQMGGTAQQFGDQAALLYSLGRGLLVRLEPVHDAVVAACQLIAGRIGRNNQITFLLDYGKQGVHFVAAEESVRALCSLISANFPTSNVAISASSFPDSFVSLTQQPIYERGLYERVRKSMPGLIYSDRGSARAEKQSGGGGLPKPRVDYAGKDAWYFFRQDADLASPFLGYQRQALALLVSPIWNKALKLWGCQMVERTAAGDSSGGISSANRSTAVRINLHLHRQLYYDDEAAFLDTDEEWTD